MPDSLTIVDDDGAGFELAAVDPIGGYRHIAEITPTTEGPPVWLTGEEEIACTICGDSEPFHVHVNGGRMEDYFTVGRGMSDIAAARTWKARALAAESALRAVSAIASGDHKTPAEGQNGEEANRG